MISEKEVMGFVVHVHDATNFDIDLGEIDIPGAIKNGYKYCDYPDIPEVDSESEIVDGTAHRCRLRGIGVNTENNSRVGKSGFRVSRMIDRCDGWVRCKIYDIDIYKRVLLDVICPLPEGDLDLKDHLLESVREDDLPIFFEYSNRK